MFEALRGLGYEAGCGGMRGPGDATRYGVCGDVCAAALCAREAYPFDWSHEVVLTGGTRVTVKVAHVRLCHSRMLFVRA